MSKNLRPLTIDELDNLKIDEKGKLHWHDGKITIDKRINLSWWQGLLAFIAAFGTFASGAVSIIDLVLKLKG